MCAESRSQLFGRTILTCLGVDDLYTVVLHAVILNSDSIDQIADIQFDLRCACSLVSKFDDRIFTGTTRSVLNDFQQRCLSVDLVEESDLVRHTEIFAITVFERIVRYDDTQLTFLILLVKAYAKPYIDLLTGIRYVEIRASLIFRDDYIIIRLIEKQQFDIFGILSRCCKGSGRSSHQQRKQAHQREHSRQHPVTQPVSAFLHVKHSPLYYSV